MQSRSKAALFWPALITIALVDAVTKGFAERVLGPQRIPHDVVGSTVRLTLVYNPGAAFGLHLGDYSRWIFTALTMIALLILARLYLATARGNTPRVVALALVCAGAVGNLIDRLRSPMGVVDFLDVGFGDMRWPTFNVADMAVSIGAMLLAWVLWQEDRQAAEQRAALANTMAPVSAATRVEQGDLV